MSVVIINTLSFSATLHGTPTDRNYADRQLASLFALAVLNSDSNKIVDDAAEHQERNESIIPARVKNQAAHQD